MRCLACVDSAYVQVDGVIVFEGEQGPLADWDEHIRSTCEAVDQVIHVLGQAKERGAS